MTNTATTTADTAAASTTADTAAASTADAPSEFVRLACDLATGAASDPTAVGFSLWGAWRDLNAKGNGSEAYRRALSPGKSWRFLASERLPRGTFLASDRRATVHGDVFPGDLIADFERSIRRGASCGEAVHDEEVGLVVGEEEKVVWMDAIRQKDGTWRIILPTGAHLTVSSAAWR